MKKKVPVWYQNIFVPCSSSVDLLNYNRYLPYSLTFAIITLVPRWLLCCEIENMNITWVLNPYKKKKKISPEQEN